MTPTIAVGLLIGETPVGRFRRANRTRARRFAALSLTSCLVAAAGVTAAPTSAPASTTPSSGPCGGLRPLALENGALLCTHGADPAPDGVDPTVPQPLVAGPHPQGAILPDPGGDPSQIRAQAVAPGIGCDGDGHSGPRVQAIYAVPADRPDRYDQVVASIRQWAAET